MASTEVVEDCVVEVAEGLMTVLPGSDDGTFTSVSTDWLAAVLVPGVSDPNESLMEDSSAVSGMPGVEVAAVSAVVSGA